MCITLTKVERNDLMSVRELNTGMSLDVSTPQTYDMMVET